MQLENSKIWLEENAAEELGLEMEGEDLLICTTNAEPPPGFSHGEVQG